MDVTDPNLTGLKAMLELREEVSDLVTMQIIAFPQEGMYSFPGGDRLVEEALKMGADVVGAIPHFEFTREFGLRSVKRAVELAIKYGKLVDITATRRTTSSPASSRSWPRRPTSAASAN